ncbi:MAG: diguanylate cyclase domain-containing protein [Candidatus Acidiferrales bacterium]
MSELENPAVFRTILESLQTGIYLVDRDQKILFWNDGAERITGYLRQDVVGRFCVETLLANRGGRDSFASDASDAIVAVLRDGKPVAVNVSMRHKDGHRVLVRLRAVPIRNSHGTVIGAAESFEESLSVSSWDRRQGKLSDFGCIDEETGVLNRKYLFFQMREQLSTYTEYRIPFSVLCIQIDQLDHFQATHGARAVSAVQHAIAQTLGNSLRPTDFLGRLSERLFLAILTECKGPEIENVAKRLKRMVGFTDISWWGDKLSVTASFGGASSVPGDTIEVLVSRAEAALLASTTAGGNQLTVLAQ